jgi:hypothetical protein
VKEKIPPHWNTTRIENRYGGGVPDVHVCAEGSAFWIELKITKTNRINISAHQVAWNYAYYKSGGVSFFLVNPLSSPHLYLFAGDQGRELVRHGLRTGSSGSGETGTMVHCLWSGQVGSGLMDRMLELSRAGVGVQSGRESGSGDDGQDKSSRGGGREEAGRESEPWPGPGV